jgi:hypothetical protein
VDHQHDDRHHRRPHDGRVGADEHDERQQQRDRDAGPRVPGQAGHAAEHHDESDDHGAVGPGHGGEVCQRRGFHRRLGRRVESTPVADRETPEERTPRLGERLRHGDERLASAVGGGEEPGGRLGRRGTTQEDHVRRRSAGRVGLECRRRTERRAGGDAFGLRCAVRVA